MKKLIASGALVLAALFTFQPATAADLTPAPAPTTVAEQPLTADTAVLTFDSPVVATEPAPEPEPEPAPVVLVTESTPVIAEPVTEPAPVEPAPVVTTEPTPEPAPTTTTQIIHEDSPEWDCATMGNFICGLDEGKALWKATGSTADFHMVYLGLTPVGPQREGYEYIPSVINPAYHYVFFKVG